MRSVIRRQHALVDDQHTNTRWPSEREVADQVPIDIDVDQQTRVLTSVPLCMNTFALNRPQPVHAGTARDHGYRSPRFRTAGASVLDVGAFDGFYSFLAETRGATRVLAVDNEQYVHWVRDRWGIELEGGEGFRAIHGLLGSEVEYRRTDAFALGRDRRALRLHLLLRHPPPGRESTRATPCPRQRAHEGGRILLETYGVLDDDAQPRRAPQRSRRQALSTPTTASCTGSSRAAHSPTSPRSTAHLRTARDAAHRWTSPHHRSD